MRPLLLFGLLACALTVGCDSSTPADKREGVSGKVTLDGVPLAEGTISFDAGDGAVPGNAEVRGGAYTLAAKPGKNRVVIRAFRIDPKVKVSTDPVRPIDGRVNYVPAIYNDKTTLSAEVGATKTFDFALMSTPK